MKVRKLSAILLAGALMATPAVTTAAMAESSQTDSADSTQNIVDESGNLIIEGTTVTGVTEKGKTAKDIIIPDGVTHIDVSFESCTNLENVYIPDDTVFPLDVFRNCKKLKNINVSSRNEYVRSIDGVLFQGSNYSLTLVFYPEGRTDESYSIPDVYNIGDMAICNDSLKSITIPYYGSFYGNQRVLDCPNLTDVYFSGTEEDWKKMFEEKTAKDFGIPETATIHYNNNDESSAQDIVDPSGNLKIEGTVVTGVTEQGETATEIVIPEGVTKIDSSFYSCKNLKSVTIPASVTKIGELPFYSCDSLESINVSENNKNYVSVDGVLFNKDKTELIRYPSAKANTSYTVPDGVKIIGDWAFAPGGWYNDDELKFNLTEVIIPDSVTKIGYGAFSGSSISSVKIGEGVTEIGIGAFGYTDLTSVTIPKSVKTIGNLAFSDCKKLEEVKYSDGLKDLGRDVFDNTPWLEKKSDENPLVVINGILIDGSKCKGDVVIPSTVTVIQPETFEDNENITSVVIPEGVTKIDVDTFSGCTKLENITIPKSVTFIYDSAFEKTPWLENKIKEDPMVIVNDILIDGSALKGDVVIPNNVKMISYCFTNFGEEKTITSLTFGKKVKTMFLDGYFPVLSEIYFNGSQEQFDKIVVYAYPHKGGAADMYDLYTHMDIQTLEKGHYDAGCTFHFAKPVTLTTENVVLDAEAGVLPDGAKLNVEPIADKTDSTMAAYEITLTENDKEIQPDGDVTVKIPVPAALKGKTLYVFRAEDDGKYTNMNAKLDGDYMVFTTDHFSEYVVTIDGTLADTPESSDSDNSSDNSDNESSDSENSNSGSDKSPNTGFGGIAMSLGVFALAGAAVLVSRKKTK